MSESATRDYTQWGDHAPGILTASIPVPPRRYEPIIVTTMRRYFSRGASPGLLNRLSGGFANFKYLNAAWNLDGRGAALPRDFFDRPTSHDGFDFLGVLLSTDERRLALVQLVAAYAKARQDLPTDTQLGRYFGCSSFTIEGDLDELVYRYRIARTSGRRYASVPPRPDKWTAPTILGTRSGTGRAG